MILRKINIILSTLSSRWKFSFAFLSRLDAFSDLINRSLITLIVLKKFENFMTQVNSNFVQFFRYVQSLQQNHIQSSNAEVTSLSSFSLANVFDFQIFVQVLIDVIQRNFASIASMLITLFVVLLKFEKFFDIKKYEKNRN